MDYMDMIDIMNEDVLFNNTIRSISAIGLNESSYDDIISESSISENLKKIKDRILKVLRELKNKIIEFFKKIFNKSKMQDNVIYLIKKDISDIEDEDVNPEQFVKAASECSRQAATILTIGSSNNNSNTKDSKDSDTLGIGKNDDMLGLPYKKENDPKPINMGTTKSGPTIAGYDYKNMHVKLNVIDRDKVSRVLSVTRNQDAVLDQAMSYASRYGIRKIWL